MSDRKQWVIDERGHSYRGYYRLFLLHSFRTKGKENDLQFLGVGEEGILRKGENLQLLYPWRGRSYLQLLHPGDEGVLLQLYGKEQLVVSFIYRGEAPLWRKWRPSASLRRRSRPSVGAEADSQLLYEGDEGDFQLLYAGEDGDFLLLYGGDEKNLLILRGREGRDLQHICGGKVP